MADGSYFLSGPTLLLSTCCPRGAEGSLYSADVVPILPGLCSAAYEALRLPNCQSTNLPLILGASTALAFLQGQEGTKFLT